MLTCIILADNMYLYIPDSKFHIQSEIVTVCIMFSSELDSVTGEILNINMLPMQVSMFNCRKFKLIENDTIGSVNEASNMWSELFPLFLFVTEMLYR